MHTVLITLRLGLAAVFAVAAIAKLADAPGSRRALESFAVAPAIVPVATFLLPAAELAAAVLLVFSATAVLGAAIATVLVLTFVGGIAAALRRGTAPDCHCFGQLRSKPAGSETLVRNGVLAAFSLFVLVEGPGPSVSAWLDDSRGELVALAGTGLLAVVLGYACASLWNENRKLTGRGRRPEPPAQLEIGALAPDFNAVDLEGHSVASSQLLGGERRTVLVFTSATCGPCVGLLPELARWREMLTGRLDIHVLATGDEAENRRHSAEQGMPLFLDLSGQATGAFRIQGTPSAVEVDETGRVGTPTAIGGSAIEGLIRAALKRPSRADGLVVRQVAGRLGASSAIAD